MERLVSDLGLQAQSAGYDIVSNGCPTKSKQSQSMSNLLLSKNKNQPADCYQGTLLKNDKKNSQGKIGIMDIL